MKILLWCLCPMKRPETDFYLALAKVCGWEFRHISDFSGAIYSSQEDFDRVFSEYKPDIVGDINRFRYNMPIDIPDSVFYFSYWDYPLLLSSGVMGECGAGDIHKNDYVLSPFLDIEKFSDTNFIERLHLRNKVISFPFYPWNYIYHSDSANRYRALEKYECDVAIVYRYKDPLKSYLYYLNLDNNFSQKSKIMCMLGRLIQRCQKYLEENNGKVGDYFWLKGIVSEEIKNNNLDCKCSNAYKMIEWWLNYFKHDVIPEIYGNFVAGILADEKVDLKIWGPGWEIVPKYKEYAAGCIKEGSDELRLVYQGCKILVNGDPAPSLHRRVFEAMLGKAMVIQMEIDESTDISNWRHLFKENESIVIARSKNELIDKIHYYLEHEDERKRIAENAYAIFEKCDLIIELKNIGEKIEKIVEVD